MTTCETRSYTSKDPLSLASSHQSGAAAQLPGLYIINLGQVIYESPMKVLLIANGNNMCHLQNDS